MCEPNLIIIEVDEVEMVLQILNKKNGEANDSRNDTLNDNVSATYMIIRLNPSIQRKGVSDLLGKSVATIGDI